jgi:hypothetical protein
MAETDYDSNMLYLPQDTLAALGMYAEDERKRMENPLVQKMITPKSLAQNILKTVLIKRGYMYQNGKVKER